MVKGDSLEKQARKTLLAYLQEIPFLQAEPVSSRPTRPQNLNVEPDILLRLKYAHDERLLLVEVKNSGQPKTARAAINQLSRYQEKLPNSYGLFFAPYISPRAADLCKAENIGYADLAGNCYLSLPQIYIRREEWPNPLKQKRELRSLYSPKAARILRVLLVTAGERRPWKVEALAKEAGVSLGQVSNVKKRLAEREWIQSEPEGFWLSAPADVLQEWSKIYNYRRHTVHDFYSLKSIADMEADLASLCEQEGLQYALAGFSAGARLAPSVRFQRAMAYMTGNVEKLAKKMKLKKVASGANLSIMVPSDDGVFYGARPAADGAQIVAPIQAYLDLKGYRGRGEEAAEAIFEQVIKPTWP